MISSDCLTSGQRVLVAGWQRARSLGSATLKASCPTCSPDLNPLPSPPHPLHPGNIWTHLLPALLILALAAGGQLEVWAGAAVSYWINVLSIAACFFGSVLYHTCMAHHCMHDRLLKLDVRGLVEGVVRGCCCVLWAIRSVQLTDRRLTRGPPTSPRSPPLPNPPTKKQQVCGILLVLCGGGHMVLWWGLACFPTTRFAFALAYAACGVFSVAATLHARSALQRGLPLLGLLLLRLGVYAARVVLEGGSGAVVGTAMQHYLAMEGCSLVGGLLNVARVPERWLQPSDPEQPAPLDYWLNSHQVSCRVGVRVVWRMEGTVCGGAASTCGHESTAECPAPCLDPHPTPQLMHVLVAAAMWQLHLGAAADYRAVVALESGEARCPTA